MRLQRAALLAAVEARMKAGARAHEAAQAKAARKYERDLAAWQNGKAQQLAKALDAMAKRGTPVDGQELRRLTGYYSQDPTLTWEGGEPPTTEPYSNVDMEGLRAFLLTLDDDTVTTQQLSSLGWRNLERLYREAATA